MAISIWKVAEKTAIDYTEYFFFNKVNAINEARKILQHYAQAHGFSPEFEHTYADKFGTPDFTIAKFKDYRLAIERVETEDSPELIVKLPDKGFLKAEIGADPNYPSIITSYSLDGNEWTQDLCMAEQKQDKKNIDIYVWADVNDENYTCKYEVGKFNEELWLR